MRIKAFPELKLLNPRGENENGYEFGFVKDFRSPKSRVSLDFDELVLVNEDYKRLNEWIYDQQGRFENVEAIVEVDTKDANGNIIVTSYPHYLDIQNVRKSLNEYVVRLQARKGTDHFFENADALIWQVIRNKGFLTDAMIEDVDYIIVPANVKMERAITILLTISLIDQFNRTVFEVQKLIGDGLDVPSGIPTTLFKITALVIHFAIIVVSLIQSFTTLKELYFPKLRQFKAVSDWNLLKAGCECLGYTLVSDELENELSNVYTMGAPFAQVGKSFLTFFQETVTGYFNYGYPTSEDSTPTLWSLFEYYIDGYNFKIFVYDGIVRFEPRSYFVNTATQTIKKTYSDQDKRDSIETFYNGAIDGKPTSWGRKYLTWETDYSDVHSPDSSIGAQAEYISQSQNPYNDDLVNLVGLSEHRLPFAWAGRKNELTKIEEIILSIFQFVDAIINSLGGNSNFASVVSGRIGVMVIEKEYFESTKKLWLVPNAQGKLRQPSNYQALLSADKIYTDYHIDLEVPNNCYNEIEIRVPYTEEKFQELLQNNFVNLTDGVETQIVEVAEVDWKNRQAAAIFTILVPDESAFNVETIKIT